MAYNDFIEDEISDINGITVAVQTYTACQAAAAWKQFFDEQLRGGGGRLCPPVKAHMCGRYDIRACRAKRGGSLFLEENAGCGATRLT